MSFHTKWILLRFRPSYRLEPNLSCLSLQICLCHEQSYWNSVSHSGVLSDISRTARTAGERGRRDASALDPVQVPAPGTGTTSRGSNMARRAVIKATTTRTGATAAPPRSPRIKIGVDTDEAEQGPTGGSP